MVASSELILVARETTELEDEVCDDPVDVPSVTRGKAFRKMPTQL
jgi:hypothetical protein